MKQAIQPKNLVASSILLLSAAALYVQFLNWNFDDGYIVFRIVQNILSHNSWSYNLGESYNPSTSILNPIIISLGVLLYRDIPTVAHIEASIWILGSGLVIYRLFSKVFYPTYALIGALIVMHHLGNNSTWGLETHLLIMLALIFVLLECQAKNSYLLLGLLILTRPDGVLFTLFKLIKEAIGSKKIPWRGVVQVAIVLLPWSIFAQLHFDRILPDTLSSKIWQGKSGYWGQGAIYWDALQTHLKTGYSPALLFGGVLAGCIWIRQKSPWCYLLFFVICQQIAYCILNIPLYHWYVAPFNFVLLVGNLYALGTAGKIVIERYQANIPDSASRIFTYTTATLCCLFVLQNLSSVSKDARSDGRDQALRTLSVEINNTNLPSGNLAALEVGTLGYYINRPILDLTGLTSARGEFITGKRNKEFFRDPPQLIIFHLPVWHFEKALFDDIRFKLLYEGPYIFHSQLLPMQYFNLKKHDIGLTKNEVLKFLRENYKESEKIPASVLRQYEKSEKTVCALDVVNSQLNNTNLLPVAQPLLQLSGWAFVKGSAPSSNIYILLTSENGDAYQIMARRVARGDVARSYNDQLYLHSGFEAEGLVFTLPKKQKYTLAIVQTDGKGISLLCEISTRILLQRL